MKQSVTIVIAGRELKCLLNPDPHPRVIIDLDDQCAWCTLNFYQTLASIAEVLESRNKPKQERDAA